MRDLAQAARLAFLQTPRVLRLVFEADRASVIAIVGLAAVASSFPAATAYVGKLIIDRALFATKSGAAEDRSAVLHLVLLELALVTLVSLINLASQNVRTSLGTKLGYLVQLRIMEKALTLELRHFEDPATYDLLQRATRESTSRPIALFNTIVGVFGSIVQLVSYGAMLSAFSPLVIVILFVTTLPVFLVEARFSDLVFRVFSWRAPEQRKLQYLAGLVSGGDSVKEVKLYGLGPLLTRRYQALYEKLFKEERAITLRKNLWSFVAGNVSSLGLYGCYAWIALRTVEGRLTIGDMTLYMTVFRGGQSALRSILNAIGSTYEHNLFLSNLYDYLALPSEHVPALDERHGSEAPPGPKTGFVLENVSFTYPGAQKPALENVSLSIGATDKLAIVGENGAGKSTLIKLLSGLYPPTSGRITLDGVPLEAIDREQLRRRFGTVLQDFVRYHFTASDNVGLGEPSAIEDRGRIERAAEAGGADVLLRALPKGFDTQLGRLFEGGVDLSMGSWQKVAIARAFMREADILILDEPTAALDAEAEHALFVRFQALTEGRMAILISHRFSTVRMADRILVLQNGRIEEIGAHAELLAREGRYAHLFRLQAKGYLDG